MIVLNVIYKCKPGKREAFLAKINEEGIGAASRAEEGNIKYDYYMSEARKDELFLLEKWQDVSALDRHKEQAHFKRLGELKAEYVETTEIARFDVANEGV